MSCCYRLMQSLVTFFHVAILALTIGAGVSDSWWESTWLRPGAGLWQLVKGSNEKRMDLFEFKYHKHFDIILVTLCAGAAFMFISLVLSILSVCQKYPSKCLILTESILVLFNTLSIGFGVLWALLKVSTANTGYAFYLAYAAIGVSIFSLCLLILLLCTNAPSPYRSTNRDDEIAMLHR